ncbi:receptor-like protein 46 [Fagus crenata]
MLSGFSINSCGSGGEIPDWISSQKRLGFLDLGGNQLEGVFPQWVAEMEVTSIILSDNNLIGSLPSRLFNSQNLSVLILSHNNFYGELPDNIGKVPESISNIYDLMFLDLSNNRFSGNTLPDFRSSGQLEVIDLSSNEFSGEIPTNLSPVTRILALGKNKFSGNLSINLTNMIWLRYLDIHDNKITELGNLASMIDNPNSTSSSVLGDSTIWYYIPFGSFISVKLSDLQVNWKMSIQGLSSRNLNLYSLLDLSMTQLSGGIPDSLGSLKALKVLNISRNNLSGKVPTSLGDLDNIESLDLSRNKLWGSIPQSLAKLQQLAILDVSNNKLTGKIPRGSQMDTMNERNFYANNSGLCGMQIKVPCPEELSPPDPPKDESKGTWFSWEGVWIGYLIGFFVVVGSLYLTGYFVPAPSSNRRRQQRQFRI